MWTPELLRVTILMMKISDYKAKAIKLRRLGKTYSEILIALDYKVSKSSLSIWLREITLSKKAVELLELKKKTSNTKARSRAIEVNGFKRKQYLDHLENKYEYLTTLLKNRDTALIALAMIYLGEGSKTDKGSLALGNSDPNVIQLFLSLLKKSFDIDAKKFRCTVQCRADQNTDELEKFWSKITMIPLSQFYSTRIDLRTLNKPTRKKNYKGVCNVEYFSADIYNSLMAINKILTRACSSVG